MMTAAGLLLLAMTVMIGADVLFRNIGAGGITLLAAPGLLRQGRHIRVDIVLRAVPRRLGWLLEWVGDAVGLVCCLIFVWYGLRAAAASFFDGSVSIKTLVLPEWWLLAPMPVAFALLAIEFGFRLQRLAVAERRPRDDAVSAS
jgi:TRAP-type C4-dicarboxylate transport system permease small subunit